MEVAEKKWRDDLANRNSIIEKDEDGNTVIGVKLPTAISWSDTLSSERRLEGVARDVDRQSGEAAMRDRPSMPISANRDIEELSGGFLGRSIGLPSVYYRMELNRFILLG